VPVTHKGRLGHGDLMSPQVSGLPAVRQGLAMPVGPSRKLMAPALAVPSCAVPWATTRAAPPGVTVRIAGGIEHEIRRDRGQKGGPGGVCTAMVIGHQDIAC